jgi:hypothetical protein
MDWIQFSILIVTMGGFFLWNRGESRADNRRALDLIEAISKEMKDFHGRLCAIEERSKLRK